jgi:hypothetical protein
VAQEMATDQPTAAVRRVIVFGVPSIERLQRTQIRPHVDRASTPVSSRAPLPYALPNSMTVKEW